MRRDGAPETNGVLGGGDEHVPQGAAREGQGSRDCERRTCFCHRAVRAQERLHSGADIGALSEGASRVAHH